MINTSPQFKRLLLLAFGAVFFLFGVLWLWSWQTDLPKPQLPVLDPFTVALCLASLAGVGWFLRRYRARGNGASMTGDERAEAGGSLPAERTAGGGERPQRSVEDPVTLRWLVRLGCVVSAILLLGLATGQLLSVIFGCVLIAVVVAFVFILVLVPRGL